MFPYNTKKEFPSAGTERFFKGVAEGRKTLHHIGKQITGVYPDNIKTSKVEVHAIKSYDDLRKEAEKDRYLRFKTKDNLEIIGDLGRLLQNKIDAAFTVCMCQILAPSKLDAPLDEEILEARRGKSSNILTSDMTLVVSKTGDDLATQLATNTKYVELRIIINPWLPDNNWLAIRGRFCRPFHYRFTTPVEIAIAEDATSVEASTFIQVYLPKPQDILGGRISKLTTPTTKT